MTQALSSHRTKLQSLIGGKWFQNSITVVIIINAITLGLETSETMMSQMGGLLTFIDQLALKIFILEILLKLYAFRLKFFTQGWNVFDFLIVGITLLPSSGVLSVLRALRILRVLRLFSIVPKLRSIVNALLEAIPGMFSIVGILLLVFYISSVLSTKLFGAAFPRMVWVHTRFDVLTLPDHDA